MPFDMTLALRKSANGICSRPLVRNYSPAVPTRTVADEGAQGNVVGMRPIEPMLLLHQEQARTFQLIGEAVSRGFKALMR